MTDGQPPPLFLRLVSHPTASLTFFALALIMSQLLSGLFRPGTRHGYEGNDIHVSSANRRRLEPAKGKLRKIDHNSTLANNPYKAAFHHLPPSQRQFDPVTLLPPRAAYSAANVAHSRAGNRLEPDVLPTFLRADCCQFDPRSVQETPARPVVEEHPQATGPHNIRRKPVPTSARNAAASSSSYSMERMPACPFKEASRSSLHDSAYASSSESNEIRSLDDISSQAKRICQDWSAHSHLFADFDFGAGSADFDDNQEAGHNLDWNPRAHGSAFRDIFLPSDDLYNADSGSDFVTRIESQYVDKGKGRADSYPEQLHRPRTPVAELWAPGSELDWWERKGEEELELGGWEHLSEEEEQDIDRQNHEDEMRAAQLEMEQQRERERQEEQEHQRTLDEAVAAMIVFEQELECELERQRELRARIECACCGDLKAPKAFPPHLPTYTCAHTSQTCQECLETWLDTELSSKGSTDLKCPDCLEPLTHSDVKRCASEHTFLAYDKLLTRNALSSLPNFAWCLNPSGCSSGQINTSSPSSNYMRCNACKYAQCLRHKCAWHKNETCAQYDHRRSGRKAREDEAATLKMLDSVSKKCPGPKCGWRIQKTEGCDHMTCKKCKWEFCWQCLASQGEIKRIGNTAHLKWCKFHSENLEASWPFNVH